MTRTGDGEGGTRPVAAAAAAAAGPQERRLGYLAGQAAHKAGSTRPAAKNRLDG